MGRKQKFERRDLADAALRLVAERGPRAVTIAAVARETGAPTGSIYYRYPSREQLLAELWMDVVERFQTELTAVLASAQGVEGAVTAERAMLSWTRQHPLEARLLLLHRRQDFIEGDWPQPLADRAAALEPALAAALRDFARRSWGSSSREVMTRLRFALLDAPFGAIKPYVQAGQPIPDLVDELIATTIRAVLGKESTWIRNTSTA